MLRPLNAQQRQKIMIYNLNLLFNCIPEGRGLIVPAVQKMNPSSVSFDFCEPTILCQFLLTFIQNKDSKNHPAFFSQVNMSEVSIQTIPFPFTLPPVPGYCLYFTTFFKLLHESPFTLPPFQDKRLVYYRGESIL